MRQQNKCRCQSDSRQRTAVDAERVPARAAQHCTEYNARKISGALLKSLDWRNRCILYEAENETGWNLAPAAGLLPERKQSAAQDNVEASARVLPSGGIEPWPTTTARRKSTVNECLAKVLETLRKHRFSNGVLPLDLGMRT